MTKVLPVTEPHSTDASEAQNQPSVPRGAPDKQTPTGDHAMTPRFDNSLGLHAFLGFVCLALLGLGFLLLETGDWIFFLSLGATSCAVGVATSGAWRRLCFRFLLSPRSCRTLSMQTKLPKLLGEQIPFQHLPARSNYRFISQ